MSISSHPGDLALAELIRFSSKVAASNPPRRLRRLLSAKSRQQVLKKDKEIAEPVAIVLEGPQFIFADPLSPLKARDNAALAALFDRDDLAEIETDVDLYLSFLYPEPCWDEETFAFLAGYI
jgi:hypothetical protein